MDVIHGGFGSEARFAHDYTAPHEPGPVRTGAAMDQDGAAIRLRLVHGLPDCFPAPREHIPWADEGIRNSKPHPGRRAPSPNPSWPLKVVSAIDHVRDVVLPQPRLVVRKICAALIDTRLPVLQDAIHRCLWAATRVERPAPTEVQLEVSGRGTTLHCARRKQSQQGRPTEARNVVSH